MASYQGYEIVGLERYLLAMSLFTCQENWRLDPPPVNKNLSTEERSNQRLCTDHEIKRLESPTPVKEFCYLRTVNLTAAIC